MERFDMVPQSGGVVVNGAGRRNIGVRLSHDCPGMRLRAGDLLAVDVDDCVVDGSVIVVSVDDGLFIAHAHLYGDALCFWFRGQRFPVTRATWGDKSTPVVFGIVHASGRIL